MNSSSFVGLVNNAALLLALSMLCDMLELKPESPKQVCQNILIGLISGGIGIAIMFNPWNFGQGVLFDTRSVLLCLSGFFFGTLPVLTAMMMTSAFRLFTGGTGAWTGVGVIVTSGAIGLAWRYLRRGGTQDPTTGELYLLGIVVHVSMLAWMLSLPWKVALDVLAKISLPVMLIYPFTTAVMGKLMVNRGRRKKTEEALNINLIKYRTLFESLPIGVTLSDQNGQILESNKTSEKLLGLPRKELSDRKINGAEWRIIRTDGSSMLPDEYASVKALKENRLVENVEMGIVKGKDDITWIDVSAVPVPLEDYGVLIAYNDITKRKQTEEALKASEEKFRNIFHNHNAVKLIIDPDNGNIVDANQAAARFYGWSVDALKMMKISQINTLPPDRVKQEMEKARGSKNIYFEFKHRKADGTVVDVEVFSSKVNIEGKEYLHSIIHDITEKRELEHQLLQAHKMESVGRLAGGVAHDFNNMLGVILGHTEMMLMGMTPQDPNYAELEEIQKAAQRSADLTRQLLAFARKQTISPKVLDLNDTVEGMLKMLRRLIGEDIDVVWQPDADLWPVKMDPAQIDQILANLCVNARGAISGVGKVTIETKNVLLDEDYSADREGFIPGEYVMLAVSDDGCGMDENTQAQIFEPFFTTRGVGEGTGLGLATVYGIVKQNNGYINVYSEVGKGTTFKICIPRYAGDVVEEIKSDFVEIPKGHGETIILVEDDPSILNMGKAMLERLGYTVLSAGDSSQVLDLVKEHKGQIHLLITDVVMPKMSGKDLALQIETLKPEIKTLFMSGYTANVIAHRGILDAEIHFIQKPFSMRDLGFKVREALGA